MYFNVWSFSRNNVISFHSYIDPNNFIAKLGLDPQVQQDAQEFSKLFISLLESSLSKQKNVKVRELVQNQFRGRYAYVTRCCKCKNESERPSYFYELDLPLQVSGGRKGFWYQKIDTEKLFAPCVHITRVSTLCLTASTTSWKRKSLMVTINTCVDIAMQSKMQRDVSACCNYLLS